MKIILHRDRVRIRKSLPSFFSSSRAYELSGANFFYRCCSPPVAAGACAPQRRAPGPDSSGATGFFHGPGGSVDTGETSGSSYHRCCCGKDGGADPIRARIVPCCTTFPSHPGSRPEQNARIVESSRNNPRFSGGNMRGNAQQRSHERFFPPMNIGPWQGENRRPAARVPLPGGCGDSPSVGAGVFLRRARYSPIMNLKDPGSYTGKGSIEKT